MKIFDPYEPLDDYDAETKRRAKIAIRAKKSRKFRRFLTRECSKDFWFWFNNFCWTENSVLGLIPSMSWDFQKEFPDLFFGTTPKYQSPLGLPRNCMMVKSREVGYSFWIAACCTWAWLFKRRWMATIMSLKEDEVDCNTDVFGSTMFSKIRFILYLLPSWMLPASYRDGRNTRFDKYLHIYNPDTKSLIVGRATSPNGFRGKRCDRVIIDEANFVPLQAQIQSALRIGPLFIGSSVKGRTTYFAQLAHDEVEGLTLHHDIESSVGKPGWVRYDWRYYQRPDRDPSTPEGKKWYDATKAETPKEVWAAEYECDFTASTPGLIWPDVTDQHVLSKEEWLDFLKVKKSCQLIEGWDFGSGKSLTAWVIAAYCESNDTLYLLDYKQWEEGTLEEVVDYIGERGYFTNENQSGTQPYWRGGDIAGRNSGARMSGGRYVNSPGSWIGNLRDCGIHIRGQTLPIEKCIEIIGRKSREMKLRLSPHCARRKNDKHASLKECMESYCRQYSKNNFQNYIGDTPKPEKNKYSHIADAIQHIAKRAWL